MTSLHACTVHLDAAEVQYPAGGGGALQCGSGSNCEVAPDPLLIQEILLELNLIEQ